MTLCNRHGLRVVEDAAQAPLAEIAGVPCGTFGDLSCFSFQPSNDNSWRSWIKNEGETIREWSDLSDLSEKKRLRGG